MVGQKGRRKGESTYNDVDLRQPDISRFLTRDKKADVWPWSVRRGEEKVSPPTMTCKKGESTYHDLYLRRPDIDRFLTGEKKLPTSGHGRSEGEKER